MRCQVWHLIYCFKFIQTPFRKPTWPSATRLSFWLTAFAKKTSLPCWIIVLPDMSWHLMAIYMVARNSKCGWWKRFLQFFPAPLERMYIYIDICLNSVSSSSATTFLARPRFNRNQKSIRGHESIIVFFFEVQRWNGSVSLLYHGLKYAATSPSTPSRACGPK